MRRLAAPYEPVGGPIPLGDTCGAAGPYLGRIKRMVSAVDDTLTRRLAGLPEMPPDSVTAVTDSSVRRRAAIAYGRSITPPDTVSPRRVPVIRVGSRYYMVIDTTRRGGEWAGGGAVIPSALSGKATVILGL